MKGSRRDVQRLRDILGAIARIEAWEDHAPGQWPEDMYRAAVLRELALVGEAAAHLSRRYTDHHPEIPWDRVRSLRNRIIHQYWDTAWARIESVLGESLPELKAAIGPDVGPPSPPIQPGAFESAAQRPPLVPRAPTPASDLCGAWMPRARVRCGLRNGHGGHHRQL